MSRRRVAFVGALCAVGFGGPQATAQSPAGPVVEPELALVVGRVDPEALARYALRVRMPQGWSLYGPTTDGLGLPLRVAWRGREGAHRDAVLAWPPEEAVDTGWGRARVYRGRVTLALRAPAPGEALTVEWALCRRDLCVPGRTELSAEEVAAAPGGRSP